MVVALICVTIVNLVLVLLFAFHVKGEAKRLAALTKEAFAYIKAGSNEEKVRTDALERQFLQQDAQEITPAPAQSINDRIMAGETVETEDGHRWQIA